MCDSSGSMHTIYDRIVKRCFSLSETCTIHLINGLYGTDYPPDSKVTYNWTEHHDNELKRTLADTIITITCDSGSFSYHVETQMTEDREIVIRMFEYGFGHAMNHPRTGGSTENVGGSGNVRSIGDIGSTGDTGNTGNIEGDENQAEPGRSYLTFPEPLILYLYGDDHTPPFHQLIINFGSQSQFVYTVPAINYLKIDLEELNRKKLIVLIPFQLLRLRKEISKRRTPENIDALKYLIQHDIIESIKVNEKAGNITPSESRRLKQLTLQLYHHIYDEYDEIEEAGVNKIVEDALVLDIDVIEYEHRLELEKLASEKNAEISEKDAKISEKDAEISEKNAKISEKDAEISEKNHLLEVLQQELLKAGKSPEEIAALISHPAKE